MLTKASFTAEEWSFVRDAPHLAAMATATAASSGLFGSISEAMTAGKEFVEAFKSPRELYRAISHPEEMKAVRDAIQTQLRTLEPGKAGEWIQSAALEKCRQAIAVVAQKGTPEEVSEYRAWIVEVAGKIANAAKEGGFLGFGGERVSAPEKGFLDQLRQVVGA